MRFEYTEEQAELAVMIGRMWDRVSDAPVDRGLWTDSVGRDERVWSGLAEAGATAILVPESRGGAGGDLTDLALVLAEAGRRALPDAVIEGLVVAPVALALSETAVADEWSAALAEGGARATAVLGDARYAPDAHVSDIIILESDGDVRVYERGDVELSAMPSMDPSRRIFQARPIGAGVSLALSSAARDRILAHQDAALALVLGGLSSALIDQTVEYVKVRSQFGRPIGSFQTVKHQLAQAYSRNELARRAANSAAFLVARDDARAADAAALARLCATEAEFESNRVALQLHGGVGFTWEFDLQQWLKRGKILELAYGRRGTLAERVGRAGLSDAGARAI